VFLLCSRNAAMGSMVGHSRLTESSEPEERAPPPLGCSRDTQNGAGSHPLLLQMEANCTSLDAKKPLNDQRSSCEGSCRGAQSPLSRPSLLSLPPILLLRSVQARR